MRRKFDFLKHSRKLAPSVSRRTSSNVRTIAAIRFSTSSEVYPSCFNALAAFASFPLLRSHHGDLQTSVMFENIINVEDILRHKRPPCNSNRKDTVLRDEDRSISPTRCLRSFALLDQRDKERSECEGNSGGATENTPKSSRSDLINISH